MRILDQAADVLGEFSDRDRGHLQEALRSVSEFGFESPYLSPTGIRFPWTAQWKLRDRPFLINARPGLRALVIYRHDYTRARAGIWVIFGFEGVTGARVTRQVRRRQLEGSASPTARLATSVAARLAGPRRLHLQTEWAAVLSGDPGEGIVHTSRRQAALVVGFLVAAVRMRASDCARPFWRPVDWILRSTSRTNAWIASVVGCQAVYIVGDDGLGALVTEVWEPCGIAGAALYGLSRWLRRVRGIELATPERRPADE